MAMKLPSPRAFLAYRYDGGRCCHNAILRGGHHRGVGRSLLMTQEARFVARLVARWHGGSSGMAARRLEWLSGSMAWWHERLGSTVAQAPRRLNDMMARWLSGSTTT